MIDLKFGEFYLYLQYKEIIYILYCNSSIRFNYKNVLFYSKQRDRQKKLKSEIEEKRPFASGWWVVLYGGGGVGGSLEK